MLLSDAEGIAMAEGGSERVRHINGGSGRNTTLTAVLGLLPETIRAGEVVASVGLLRSFRQEPLRRSKSQVEISAALGLGFANNMKYLTMHLIFHQNIRLN